MRPAGISAAVINVSTSQAWDQHNRSYGGAPSTVLNSITAPPLEMGPQYTPSLYLSLSLSVSVSLSLSLSFSFCQSLSLFLPFSFSLKTSQGCHSIGRPRDTLRDEGEGGRHGNQRGEWLSKERPSVSTIYDAHGGLQ